MKSYKKCMDLSRSYLIAKKNVLTPPNFFSEKSLSPANCFRKKLFAPLHPAPAPLYSKFCTVPY